MDPGDAGLKGDANGTSGRGGLRVGRLEVGRVRGVVGAPPWPPCERPAFRGFHPASAVRRARAAGPVPRNP